MTVFYLLRRYFHTHQCIRQYRNLLTNAGRLTFVLKTLGVLFSDFKAVAADVQEQEAKTRTE